MVRRDPIEHIIDFYEDNSMRSLIDLAIRAREELEKSLIPEVKREAYRLYNELTNPMKTQTYIEAKQKIRKWRLQLENGDTYRFNIITKKREDLMQRFKTVIHVYSSLNPQVDLVVMLENEEYLECAEFIINKAYEEWFESEKGSHGISIEDYISKKLLEDDPDIKFEIYVC